MKIKDFLNKILVNLRLQPLSTEYIDVINYLESKSNENEKSLKDTELEIDNVKISSIKTHKFVFTDTTVEFGKTEKGSHILLGDNEFNDLDYLFVISFTELLIPFLYRENSGNMSFDIVKTEDGEFTTTEVPWSLESMRKFARAKIKGIKLYKEIEFNIEKNEDRNRSGNMEHINFIIENVPHKKDEFYESKLCNFKNVLKTLTREEKDALVNLGEGSNNYIEVLKLLGQQACEKVEVYIKGELVNLELDDVLDILYGINNAYVLLGYDKQGYDMIKKFTVDPNNLAKLTNLRDKLLEQQVSEEKPLR